MHKCYIEICGGIGNQMFQIASAYGYSKKSNRELVVSYERWTASQGSSPKLYEDTLYKGIKFGGIPRDQQGLTYYSEKSPTGYEDLDKSLTYEIDGVTYTTYKENDLVLCGYFQSPKYFDDYRDEVKNLFTLPEIDLGHITSDDAVAFHIRRGDYAHYPEIFGDNEEYFIRMFEKFKDRKINVFTDSPNYVEIFRRYADFTIISSKQEILDLTAMSKHKNIVCSNSSFSWWASYLGVEKDNIYVPKVWLRGRDCEDIYLDKMIRVYTI